MISAQIDELRKWADQLSERENEFGVVVRALVDALRDAADTIWQLRDDLQRANAENSKLREELEVVGTAAYVYGRDDLKAENAKLRELLHRTWDAFHDATAREFVTVKNELRELGIETGDE